MLYLETSAEYDLKMYQEEMGLVRQALELKRNEQNQILAMLEQQGRIQAKQQQQLNQQNETLLHLPQNSLYGLNTA